MSNILSFIIVGFMGIIISPVMALLVNRFCENKKIFSKDFKKDLKFDYKMALITAIILILLFLFFGFSEKFFVYSFVSVLLIMDAFTDIKAQIIPNGLNMTGFIVGIIYVYYKLIVDVKIGIDLLLGLFVGAGIFLLIALFALVAYKKEGMGLGDVKLMGMLGLFFGVKNIFQIFILSFFVGAIVSIFLLITKLKKADDYIAFGPFIVIASLVTMVIPYTYMLSLINY